MTPSASNWRAECALELGEHGGRVRYTDATSGDWANLVSGPDASTLGADLPARPVRRVRQIHSARVLRASQLPANEHGEGDAIIDDGAEFVSAILTADCIPLALATDTGALAAVHAGWRGLVAGIVEATATSLRAGGATCIWAASAPFIRPSCYEFDGPEMAEVTAAFGADVMAHTAEGRPALDLGAALALALERAGIDWVADAGRCTACDPECFSFRRDGATQRQALFVYRP